MAQEHAPNKPVHLIYLVGGLLGFVLLKWTGDWIWGYFTRTPDEFMVILFATVVTLLGGIYLYRKQESYDLVNEVATELKKVTWPTAQEVKVSTIVVVFMTLLSAFILWFFDQVWGRLTQLIYGG
ncbi:MAG: preprotein translocase subunit SecE [Myxococcales bacterium]|nr:preprotein translocase subunit SecE [Myxococcales bacterium]